MFVVPATRTRASAAATFTAARKDVDIINLVVKLLAPRVLHGHPDQQNCGQQQYGQQVIG